MYLCSMQKYGLIGKTLKHSFSQHYFESHHTGIQYSLYELPSLNNLRNWILETGVDGFNVTIPYKVSILPLLDHLTPQADAIGAVNCVKVVPDPSCKMGIRLIGHNTDAQAFLETFESFLKNGPQFPKKDMSAWILGNGGASKAVSFALQQLHLSHKILTHSEIDNLNNAQSLNAIPAIVINATPVGTHPHTSETPLPQLCDTNKFTVPEHWFCYDLIYNPEETKLLRDAALMGASTHNGLQMLHRQAELSLDFWTTKNS